MCVWACHMLCRYSKDFGKDTTEVLKTLVPWLRDPAKETLQHWLEQKNNKMTVKYFKYDWATNASRMKTFRASYVLITSTCMCCVSMLRIVLPSVLTFTDRSAVFACLCICGLCMFLGG